MVAINFQARFADLVATGEKTQTIRLSPRGIKIGTELQLYTGQRTKACRKLGDGICKAVNEIKLEKDMAFIGGDDRSYLIDLDRLAIRDGFGSYSEMYEWFSQRYKRDVITGWLIEWRRTYLHATGNGEWQAMRGAVPDLTDGLSSEAFVRKQRDEWDN